MPAEKRVSPVSRISLASSTAADLRPDVLLDPRLLLEARQRPSRSVWRSARISSVLIVSMSSLGETLPSTWTTFSSLKARMTWQIASDSRMFARNLLPRPSPSRGAAHDARDVDEVDGRREDPLRAEDLGQLGEAGVRDADHADVRLDRGERVVGRQHVVLGQGVEQGRLADIRQTDDSDRERHVATSRSEDGGRGPEVGRSTSLRACAGHRPAA